MCVFSYLQMRVSKPGVGLEVRVAVLRPQGPEFEPLSAVELTPSGVDPACNSSEVTKMSTSVLAIEALH